MKDNTQNDKLILPSITDDLDLTEKKPTLKDEVVVKLKTKDSKITEEYKANNKPKQILTKDKSETLIELCSSIHSNVEHLDLDDVRRTTITHVDNNNRSVLLINKYLISIGKKVIPVIAPGLSTHYLEQVNIKDICQGDIILYSDENDLASLGILMNANTNNILEDHISSKYKILTTSLDEVVVINISYQDIKSIMR